MFDDIVVDYTVLVDVEPTPVFVVVEPDPPYLDEIDVALHDLPVPCDSGTSVNVSEYVW